MAVWYIGAGLGNGNPYGVVIATVRHSLSHTFSLKFIPYVFRPPLSLPSSLEGLQLHRSK